MVERIYRVLMVCSHPVQYVAPLLRLMTQQAQLDLHVAYCSLQGAETGVDPEFGVAVQWDIPLLEGYSWEYVPNRSKHPSLGKFWGLVNLGLWRLIHTGKFDAVIVYTGYTYASFWIAAAAAKTSRTPLLFNTDATSLDVRSKGSSWKLRLKQWILPRIFSLADVAISTSAAGSEFLRSLGVPPQRIVMTPFVVDNDWWTAQAALVDRAAIRHQWGIPADALVVLFCAKLQPWKRPADVLSAFAQAQLPYAYLVFAGEGPLKLELMAAAESLRIADRVKFLGFVNQSQLPATYRSADLLVLPSGYDPCPVVVCEAMLCGCPVVLSDEIRGRFDIVQSGYTGYIYPCGDVDALAAILQEALSDRDRLQTLSQNAVKRMETWSPRDNAAAILQAVHTAVRLGKKHT
ncbi:MAG: glycosyltransferase [Cyanobacteria bacterium]|nr:glycosyltransferase [Cyanobacteriota bacterium]MDW8202424.1 glycosyltransferase [Cyanobacteriota bacterium SKYGB_h_bin112]